MFYLGRNGDGVLVNRQEYVQIVTKYFGHRTVYVTRNYREDRVRKGN